MEKEYEIKGIDKIIEKVWKKYMKLKELTK